jgi:hypothetical protein
MATVGCDAGSTRELATHWGGHGVHWPDIDEDISAEGMLNGAPTRRAREQGLSPPFQIARLRDQRRALLARARMRGHPGRANRLDRTLEDRPRFLQPNSSACGRRADLDSLQRRATTVACGSERLSLVEPWLNSHSFSCQFSCQSAKEIVKTFGNSAPESSVRERGTECTVHRAENSRRREVAKPGIALGSGPRDRGFESRLPDHNQPRPAAGR